MDEICLDATFEWDFIGGKKLEIFLFVENFKSKVSALERISSTVDIEGRCNGTVPS